MVTATVPEAGKKVLVTGAAGGIGRVVAAELAAHGCQLALTDLTAVEQLDAATERQVVASASIDLASHDAVEDDVRSLIDALGGCDAVVGAAAVVDILHRAEAFPLSAWKRDLDVNLTGQFAVVRAAFPALRDATDARVVLVSSVAALLGLPGQSAYAASKAGIEGLVRTIASEWAAHDIRCNVVMPGTIETPKVGALPDEVRTRLGATVPLGHFGQPQHISGTIAFLLSPAAGYITGATIRVDGGWGLNTASVGGTRRSS